MVPGGPGGPGGLGRGDGVNWAGVTGGLGSGAG